jgi:hypothetical protein
VPDGVLLDQIWLVLGAVALVGLAAACVRRRWRPGKPVDQA